MLEWLVCPAKKLKRGANIFYSCLSATEFEKLSPLIDAPSKLPSSPLLVIFKFFITSSRLHLPDRRTLCFRHHSACHIQHSHPEEFISTARQVVCVPNKSVLYFRFATKLQNSCLLSKHSLLSTPSKRLLSCLSRAKLCSLCLLARPRERNLFVIDRKHFLRAQNSCYYF